MKILPKEKKYLSFSALTQALSSHFNPIADPRQQGKCDFSYNDILMSAFACMYFQDPSLLQFQKRTEEKEGRNNLRNLFGVENIPKDSQLRDVLDSIPAAELAPIFKDFFERLRRHKHLEDYAILPNTLLCAIDGTQYHRSKTVNCEHCLTKAHKTGDVTYSHGVLQGAIMHPAKKQVIPVMPEAIQNTDPSPGSSTKKAKQDCESKAAKRFIINLKTTHPRQQFMLGGDGLMSHQPMIETVLEHGMNYLFVAKPGDHKYLFEWIATFDAIPSLELSDGKGRTHRYRWQNDVPLHSEANAVRVNFCEYQLMNEKGKLAYINSWVTDIVLSKENIEGMVRAGRCRWKIENECFNTLKNQGYHIEHNYGHGKKHLSYNMYLLTLLAFYCHQILELTDLAYQACREKFGSKRYLWEVFRGNMRELLFDSWTDFMDFILNPDDWEVTRVKKA